MTQISFLSSWKEIANLAGKHPRTVRQWHYRKVRLPVEEFRTSDNPRAKFIIPVFFVLEWFRALRLKK